MGVLLGVFELPGSYAHFIGVTAQWEDTYKASIWAKLHVI